MSDPVIFGANYSVYTRIVRAALEEKRIPYELTEVDVFAEGGLGEEYLARHPFVKIPAFEHDGFQLFETGAITRYIDEAFDGPALMPEELDLWSRANQIISILDNYAYRTLVWDIFVERVRVPEKGGTSDEDKIALAVKQAATCMDAITGLRAEGSYFLGNFPTLPDLYAAPMIALFRLAPEGNELLVGRIPWVEWWARMSERPCMIKTRMPQEP